MENDVKNFLGFLLYGREIENDGEQIPGKLSSQFWQRNSIINNHKKFLGIFR